MFWYLEVRAGIHGFVDWKISLFCKGKSVRGCLYLPARIRRKTEVAEQVALFINPQNEIVMNPEMAAALFSRLPKGRVQGNPAVPICRDPLRLTILHQRDINAVSTPTWA